MEKKGKIDKTIERWEKIRAKGKWRYCLVYGSLFWGGFMGVFLSLFDLLQKEFDIKRSVLRLGIFLLFGFFYGMWQWKTKEKYHQQYKDL
jgi:hypothetical protein